MTSVFGKRKSPITGRVELHDGLDISAKVATRALAVCDGVILSETKSSTWGMNLMLDAGEGIVVRYAHLSGFLAKVGERVSKGEPIALTGKSGMVTGPHLHLSVYKDGTAIDPSPLFDQ